MKWRRVTSLAVLLRNGNDKYMKARTTENGENSDCGRDDNVNDDNDPDKDSSVTRNE